MVKLFSLEKRKNHRKCDNKNQIYELRLVIYLCANLLLQRNKKGRIRGGCDIIMSLESEKVFKKCFSWLKMTNYQKNYRRW